MRLLCILILMLSLSRAWAQDAPINLICKMDYGADLRLTIDLEKKLMWNTWLQEFKPDRERFKIIKISDSEINAEFRPLADNKTEGADKIYMSWSIERYTLKISEYNLLGLIFGQTSNWRRGQCEILKRQL